jgi:hypothetical protein
MQWEGARICVWVGGWVGVGGGWGGGARGRPLKPRWLTPAPAFVAGRQREHAAQQERKAQGSQAPPAPPGHPEGRRAGPARCRCGGRRSPPSGGAGS